MGVLLPTRVRKWREREDREEIIFLLVPAEALATEAGLWAVTLNEEKGTGEYVWQGDSLETLWVCIRVA